MRGRRVERRFGWDTHGLPAEVETERQLGIKHKAEIVGMGIEAFNDACRESVLRYTNEWEEYVTRQARWVDFENDYKTLDLNYMESVMWAFKTLWDKGLIYEGYRVLWYCTRCETPLAATETKMDDTYQMPAGPGRHGVAAAAVGRSAAGRRQRADLDDDALDAAVQPGRRRQPRCRLRRRRIDRAVRRAVPAGGRPVVGLPARARRGPEGAGHLHRRAAGRAPGTPRRSTSSRTRPTTPQPDGFSPRANAFQILTADYVTTEDGTGVVHIAPAFGEEDKAVTDAAGIEVVNPVDGQGKFTAQVPPYEGYHVFDANVPIMADLKEAGLLIRRDSYEHSYPHCWRCGTPLIQRAVSSWFVAVTKIRDRMVELNQEITWVPAHIKDGQFGKWLEGARDWSISRNRFWGSPIPVWTSDDPTYPRVDVYGSLDELERDFGVRPDRYPPAVHRRADQAEPGRPDRQVHHAPGSRGAGLLVRVRLDAVRPGALPVREPGVVRATTTPAISSSSTTGRPAAGSTRCTCWPRRCSTGRHS